MRIGIPTEIKNNENRVAMTPAGAVHLVQNGHEVFVQKGAGLGSGFTDEEYVQAGAKLVETAEEAWNQDMVMKVKEPVASEYGYFREGLILFTYLHLAPEPELTKALIDNKVASIAYETVQLDNRSLPLLAPMSEVAGRMSAQIGAQFLEKNKGGKGILLAGVPGVKRGKVTIIGGGQAGTNAAKIAVGLGADVTIIDLSAERLRQLDDIFGNQVKTLMSNPYNIAEAVKESDLVIGAVLIPGAKAPKLVTEEMIQSMEPGSVVVDIAIDQGGIFETTDRINITKRGGSMGSKKRKKKQEKRQKYIKKKQEQNIPFSQKVVITIEKTFRYICMFLYVIFCLYLCGIFKCLGITPNVIEGILGVILVMVEGILFFILFDKVWPSHESKKDRKRSKKSSSNSSSSSGFGDYSSNDCSSSSDGGGDCGGGGD